jgi:hypothetical protein
VAAGVACGRAVYARPHSSPPQATGLPRFVGVQDSLCRICPDRPIVVSEPRFAAFDNMRWFRHKQSVGEVVGATGRSNRRRRHWALGMIGPADFEDRFHSDRTSRPTPDPPHGVKAQSSRPAKHRGPIGRTDVADDEQINSGSGMHLLWPWDLIDFGSRARARCPRPCADSDSPDTAAKRP